MKTHYRIPFSHLRPRARRASRWLAVGGLASSLLIAGCATLNRGPESAPPEAAPTEAAPVESAPVESAPAEVAPVEQTPEVFTLQEGDVLKVSFPGAQNLDSTQTVRRDGKITLGMVGEVSVVGRSPTELEQELLKLYSTQLVSNEVRVMVVSSSFPVFVSGAVLRPGKIMADRPLTALEAIMEAGGYDTAKADLRAVRVVRQEGGRTRNFTLDLKSVLDGKSTESFYLRRSDIVMVPERFTWF